MLKLHNWSIDGYMWRTLNDIICSNQRSRAILKNFVSESYEISEGIPQGGILSPLLWNIYFADIPTGVANREFYAAFADDLAVVTSSSDLKLAAQNLSRIYSKLREWAVHNRVEFNDKKVKCMVISRNRKWRKRGVKSDCKVRYRDRSGVVQVVPEVETYDYLGARLNNRLLLD